jgi:thiol-disulfide isomerase/thioredoxin
MNALLLVAMAAVIGADVNVDLALSKSRAQAAFALTETKPGPAPTPEPAPGKCKTCGGAGTITSGDGHFTFDCPDCDGGAPNPNPPAPEPDDGTRRRRRRRGAGDEAPAAEQSLGCASVDGKDYDIDYILDLAEEQPLPLEGHENSSCPECDLEVHLEQDHKVEIADLARIPMELHPLFHAGLHKLAALEAAAAPESTVAPTPAAPKEPEKPAPAAEPPKKVKRQVLIGFGDWCGPCQTNKPAIKRLEELGFNVGTGEDDAFVLVDPAVQNPYSVKYDILTIPQVVVLEDGVVRTRLTGKLARNLTERVLQDLYRTGQMASTPPAQAPTPAPQAATPPQNAPRPVVTPYKAPTYQPQYQPQYRQYTPPRRGRR